MKGLHRHSLRKVGNPHRWMIEDAVERIIGILARETRRIAWNIWKYGDF